MPQLVTTAASLVLGTGNRHKAEELVELLGDCGVEWLSLADFDNVLDVDETGSSFAENASLKATEQARHLSHWVLADDSGLVVDALGGAPGIFSARFAGLGASDADNRRKLLAELSGVSPERRTARFICHLALADPQGVLRATSEGHCCGRIVGHEAGTNGFGYDPLFEIVEYHRTFGELAPVVKACLSHRARAAAAIAPRLAELIGGQQRGARGG